MINIYNKEEEIILSPEVSDSSTLVQELMTLDQVSLQWFSSKRVILPAGSFIEFEGNRFYLFSSYTPFLKTEGIYEYRPVFESSVMRWKNIPFFFYHFVDSVLSSKELDWSFTDSPAKFMELVCLAIELETQEKWTFEADPNLLPFSTISFSDVDIFSALNDIAEKFETEWWADKDAKVIHLSFASSGDLFPLIAGENITVPSVSVSNTPKYTRFYAFGSSRNYTQPLLPSSNFSFTKKLPLDPEKYPYGYKDVKENLADIEIISKVVTFDHIYPKAKFVINDVRSRKLWRLDEDGNKIKLGETASGEPIFDQYSIWYFKIEDLHFSSDRLIAGLPLSVHFESGSLQGRDFELIYHDESKVTKTISSSGEDVDFNVDSGDYEIIFIEEGETIIPMSTNIVPESGNQVALFNISLDESFLKTAYQELESELDKYIAEQQRDLNSYSFSSFAKKFKDLDLSPKVGDAVSISFGENETISRIVRLEKSINSPFVQKFQASIEPRKGTIESLKEDIQLSAKELEDLSSSNKLVGTIQRDHTRELLLSTARYVAMQDSISMLQDAFEEYASGINPVTVETMALLVGNESLHFKFTVSRTDLTDFGCPLSFNPSTKILSSRSCSLVHLTLGIKDITAANARSAEDYRSWDMVAWDSDPLEDPVSRFYVYARVEKEGTLGSYVLSPSPIKMESQDFQEYYHFLIGILNAEYAETRVLILMYGVTDILPGQISTNIIRSADGSCIFDLANNRIIGPMQFLPGTTGIENIEGLPEFIKENVGDTGESGSNLLRNSGFTGDYLSEELADDDVLTAESAMFSNPLDYWNATSVVVEANELSASGYGVKFVTRGTLSQELHNTLIAGESYVLSFKAKASKSSTIRCNIGDQVEAVNLTLEANKYIVKVVVSASSRIFSLTSDDCSIWEIQLERGTMASSWGESFLDNSSDRAYWQSLKHISGALEDASTTFNGGLGLTNMMMFGKYDKETKSMTEVTAGASGNYEDDHDVAFWAGGDYASAVKASIEYLVNHDKGSWQPTEEEIDTMAKFVLTHGGTAILNDIILRGIVYATAGKFGDLSIISNPYYGDAALVGEKIYDGQEKHTITIRPDYFEIIAYEGDDVAEFIKISPYWYPDRYDMDGIVHIYAGANRAAINIESGFIRGFRMPIVSSSDDVVDLQGYFPNIVILSTPTDNLKRVYLPSRAQKGDTIHIINSHRSALIVGVQDVSKKIVFNTEGGTTDDSEGWNDGANNPYKVEAYFDGSMWYLIPIR